MTCPDHHLLETVTGPGALSEIHRALNNVWACHPEIPSAVRAAMATGVAEIGGNIVEHAGRSGPVPLRMVIEVTPRMVTVVFTDEGDAVTVDLDALSLPDASAKHGRGLALASAVLDQLTYRRRGICNQWTLVSYFGRGRGGDGSEARAPSPV
jgi:serine/threonine-protein kinase RsbW